MPNELKPEIDHLERILKKYLLPVLKEHGLPTVWDKIITQVEIIKRNTRPQGDLAEKIANMEYIADESTKAWGRDRERLAEAVELLEEAADDLVQDYNDYELRTRIHSFLSKRQGGS